MAEFESEKQPLEEAIYDYRKKHAGPPPDFDVKFILDILGESNDASNIRIAIDPIVDGFWDKNARTFGIRECYVSDDNKLVFKIRHDRETLPAYKLIDHIEKAMKRRPSKHIPAAFELDEKIHVLSEMYGHTHVNDMWAGLPFDIILAEVTPDAKKAAGAESE